MHAIISCASLGKKVPTFQIIVLPAVIFSRLLKVIFVFSGSFDVSSGRYGVGSRSYREKKNIYSNPLIQKR